MHKSAFNNAQDFFSVYSKSICKFNPNPVLLDIGALDFTGSLKKATPDQFKYIGLDFQSGIGVDIVLQDPYKFPFKDNSVDVIVSSSCFEHSEFFWLVFLEILRCLKPSGIFYLNAPSSGKYHKYPVDCWRFFPDSGIALNKWGVRNGFNCVLLESFIQLDDKWKNFNAVYLKDKNFQNLFPERIISVKVDFQHGKIFKENKFIERQANLEQKQKPLYSFEKKLKKFLKI